jgi:membrane protease YdiL (CAAX protease family)
MMQIAFWKRLLAGVVYGGVTEELLTRLFLVSLLAWGLGFVWKAPSGLPAAGAFVVAIVLAALLFGALHLPATAAIAPLSLMLVTRALLLNGIAGVVFGFLFWRYGLEAAMFAHASAHLVLQGPGFILIRTML